jgi:imidazolonepropionase-like amidohydrolase
MALQVRKDHQMEGVFAISGKWLFDPFREKTTENVLIIVEDGRILEVGKGDIAHNPKNATLVDLGDCIVLPGLTDSHVHISMGGEKDFIL